MSNPYGWRSCGGSYGANLAARQQQSQRSSGGGGHGGGGGGRQGSIIPLAIFGLGWFLSAKMDSAIPFLICLPIIVIAFFVCR
jgi:hypothetical protein